MSALESEIEFSRRFMPNQVLERLEKLFVSHFSLGDRGHALRKSKKGDNMGSLEIAKPAFSFSDNGVREYVESFYRDEGFSIERSGDLSFDVQKEDERYRVSVLDRNGSYAIHVGECLMAGSRPILQAGSERSA